MIKFNLIGTAALTLTMLMLSSCQSIPLDQQANRVIVSPKKAPHGCKYLGQVVGNQGNFFTGGWTSNRNLEEGAMHDLKNQASKLGANYVQLLSNRAGNTGFDRGSTQQTNVTNLGNAFFCAPEKIGL